MKKGVIFSTYSSLIGESHSKGKYSTRLQQIVHWCGEDFDGVVSTYISYATIIFELPTFYLRLTKNEI